MWTKVVGAAMAVVALSGCGSAKSGSLIGVVRLYGGPVSATGHEVLNGSPDSGYTVRVTSNGHPTASSTSDKHGRFTVRLRPGSYTLASCGDPATIVIKAGATTHHDCDVPVP
jgi:hypothetical protein